MIKAQISNLILRNSDEIFLQDFHKYLYNGKIYAIIGKNGAGKTTLLNLLADSLENKFFNYTGEVYFDETKLSALSNKEELNFRKSNLRYVFQDSINSFDPLKKLRYFFKNVDSDNEEIAELFNFFRLPEFGSIQSKHIYEMSGGMAQRIQVILALLAKPKYLFLDEPTSALDFPIANRLSKKLKSYTKTNNAVTIIVTQDIRFAIDCSDEIAILKDKKLTFEENNFDYNSITTKLAE